MGLWILEPQRSKTWLYVEICSLKPHKTRKTAQEEIIFGSIIYQIWLSQKWLHCISLIATFFLSFIITEIRHTPLQRLQTIPGSHCHYRSCPGKTPSLHLSLSCHICWPVRQQGLDVRCQGRLCYLGPASTLRQLLMWSCLLCQRPPLLPSPLCSTLWTSS